MSDVWWIKSLVGGLVMVISVIASSKGNIDDDCSLCCIIQGIAEDLNCTWTNTSSSQLSVLLHNLDKAHELPQYFIIPPGQNWLLIPRKNLTVYHKYQLSIGGGTWTETFTFTYCHGCDNVFIGAPVLNSSVYEEEEGTLVVDVTWKHTDQYSHHPVVELRYRILGTSDWIQVHSDDLQPNTYQVIEPEPYTDYEFQIRYIPDELHKSRGLWSESYVLTTPEQVLDGTVDIWRSFDKEKSLLVVWKPLSHHSARGKINYHVTYVYKGTSQTTEEPCCGITLPAQSTKVCVRAKNSRGLGPQRCIATFCSVAADMGDFGGKAWGDPSGRIAVWWEDFMDYGFPEYYVVEWRKDKGSEMDWTRCQLANQTLVLPGNFSPGALYHLAVHALYNDSCVQIFSTEAYGREEVPLAAPTCSVHVSSSSEVFVSWDEVPKQCLRGKLKNYNIYVNHSLWHTVHGRNMTLSGLLPGTVYHIFMTACTAAGEGPESAPQIFQTTDEQNLHLLILPLVSLIGIGILAAAILGHPRVRKTLLKVLWPKIPKPENKFIGTASAKFLEEQQVPYNLPITEVEEMEPAKAPSPPPDRPACVSSGYEKHFMPTPEEVMGLC